VVAIVRSDEVHGLSLDRRLARSGARFPHRTAVRRYHGRRGNELYLRRHGEQFGGRKCAVGTGAGGDPGAGSFADAEPSTCSESLAESSVRSDAITESRARSDAITESRARSEPDTDTSRCFRVV